MKIAWLHSHLLIPTGGTKFLYEVTRRVAARAPLTLYCEQADAEIRTMFEDGGVPVRTIGTATSTSARYWLCLRRHLAREADVLRGALDDETAVVSNMFPMNVLANGVTDRAVQYCFEPFAFFFSETMLRGLPTAKRWFCRYLAKRYAALDIENTRKSKSLITLNRITQREIHRIYGRRSVISLAGVDADFFQPTPDPQLAERYAGQKIVMHSTDYSPIKASDLVVRAMPAILRTEPTARLLISNTLDDAPARRRLAGLAKQLGVDEKVTFLGCLPFVDVPKYSTRADVMVQPAFAADAGTASMNLAVKEAMACQTAVVRADITDEDAEHGVSGMLVKPDDPDAIAEAVAAILADADRAAAMGVAGRKRITDLYNWDHVTDVIYQNIESTFRQEDTSED